MRSVLLTAITHSQSGPMGYTLFAAARSISVIYPPIPGFPLDLLAIRMYGPTAGFVAAECGMMLGASIAFGVARVAAPRVAEWVGASWRLSRHFSARLPLPEMTPKEQFRAWLTIRLLTNPLFDPISYLAGLTSARFWPYFFGSLIGNLPTSLLFFVLEANAPEVSVLRSIVTAILFCLFVIYIADVFLRMPAEDV